MKRFHWNVETLDFFQLLKNSEGNEKMKQSVEMFVYNECDLEDNESYEDLIKDLLYQIENTTLEEIENLKK
jgi:hypothetical protein|tara:strand:- start:46 stop:258 length:213 start_codon:yes stop_codon:yes gene_type:complete